MDKSMVFQKIKNYYTIIVTILLFCFLFFVYQKRTETPTTIPLSLIDSSVIVKILKSGKVITQNETSYLSKQQVEKLLSDNKELKEQIGSLKNLISKINVRIEYPEKTVILPTRIDSFTKSLISDFEDSCLIAKIKTDTNQSHHLTYKLKPLSLELITHYKKNGFFKPKTTVLDVSVLSGCGITTKQKQIIIQPKTKRLNLGINAGYGITNKGFSPYAGFGINYNPF